MPKVEKCECGSKPVEDHAVDKKSKVGNVKVYASLRCPRCGNCTNFHETLEEALSDWNESMSEIKKNGGSANA